MCFQCVWRSRSRAIDEKRGPIPVNCVLHTAVMNIAWACFWSISTGHVIFDSSGSQGWLVAPVVKRPIANPLTAATILSLRLIRLIQMLSGMVKEYLSEEDVVFCEHWKTLKLTRKYRDKFDADSTEQKHKHSFQFAVVLSLLACAPGFYYCLTGYFRRADLAVSFGGCIFMSLAIGAGHATSVFYDKHPELLLGGDDEDFFSPVFPDGPLGSVVVRLGFFVVGGICQLPTVLMLCSHSARNFLLSLIVVLLSFLFAARDDSWATVKLKPSSTHMSSEDNKKKASLSFKILGAFAFFAPCPLPCRPPPAPAMTPPAPC